MERSAARVILMSGFIRSCYPDDHGSVFFPPFSLPRMDISQPVIPWSASPHPPYPPIFITSFPHLCHPPLFLHPPPIIRGHRAVHTRRTRNEQSR